METLPSSAEKDSPHKAEVVNFFCLERSMDQHKTKGPATFNIFLAPGKTCLQIFLQFFIIPFEQSFHSSHKK